MTCSNPDSVVSTQTDFVLFARGTAVAVAVVAAVVGVKPACALRLTWLFLIWLPLTGLRGCADVFLGARGFFGRTTTAAPFADKSLVDTLVDKLVEDDVDKLVEEDVVKEEEEGTAGLDRFRATVFCFGASLLGASLRNASRLSGGASRLSSAAGPEHNVALLGTSIFGNEMTQYYVSQKVNKKKNILRRIIHTATHLCTLVTCA
jgi:hypothetical protein